jgi:hypothetical protein
MDEGAKAKGRSSQEGERRALQRLLAGDLDESRVEGEGEGRCPYTTTSDEDMDLLDDDESPLIKEGSHHRLAWTSTWCSCCQPSSEVLRRRSLRCVSALKSPCSRSLKSRAST